MYQLKYLWANVSVTLLPSRTPVEAVKLWVKYKMIVPDLVPNAGLVPGR